MRGDAALGTLDLTVRPSRGQLALVVAAYASSIIVCGVLATTRPWLVALLPVLVIAAHRAWRRAGLRDGRALRALRWHADGGWAWRDASGWTEGGCVDALVRSDKLVVLALKPEAGGHIVRCPLFRDALAAEAHRRLRARLRIAAPKPTAAHG